MRITASHPGIKKVHLGSSVVYTVQLEDTLGPVTIGPDASDPRPSRFFVTTSTYAIVTNRTPGFTFNEDAPVSPTNNPLVRNEQGASVRNTFPIVTDDEGKATFTVSGLPDTNPLVDRDEYVVDIHIQGQPGAAGNSYIDATTPLPVYIGAFATTPTAPLPAPQTPLVAVRQAAGGADYWDGLVFSTEANDSSRLRVFDTETPPGVVVPGISTSVSPAAVTSPRTGEGPAPGPR